MRQPRLRQRKLAKKNLLRKKFIRLRNRFPMSLSRRATVKKIDGKYMMKRRITYTDLLPASKKNKPKSEKNQAKSRPT